MFGVTRGRLAAAVAAATLVTAAMAGSALPASASAERNIIDGFGTTYSDDWGNEGVLSSSAYRQSNATCLWQKVLWAEGATEQDGTAFDYADIDGDFGPNTTYATKAIQVRWNLADSISDADGKVGPNTFGKADQRLHAKSGSTAPGQKLVLNYIGVSHSFELERSAAGQYLFYYLGKWRYSVYSTNTCS